MFVLFLLLSFFFCYLFLLYFDEKIEKLIEGKQKYKQEKKKPSKTRTLGARSCELTVVLN